MGEGGHAKTKVFISYARKSDRARAIRISARLADNGFDIWRDEPSLEPSANLVARIAECLAQTDFVVAIVSRGSAESHWFKYEVTNAISRMLAGEPVIVVPILVEQCEIPAYLRNINCVDGTSDLELGIAKLIASLGRDAPAPTRWSACGLRGEAHDTLLDFLTLTLGMQAHTFATMAGLRSIPQNPQESPRESWSRILETATNQGRLGTLLRLLQQFDSQDEGDVRRVRQLRAQGILAPSSSVIGLDEFRDLTDGLWRHAEQLFGDAAIKVTRQIDRSSYTVAFVGAFSTGKSTLINALLERTVLPEMNMACTPCPTVVRRCPDETAEHIRIAWKSEKELQDSFSALLARVGVDDEASHRAVHDRNWELLIRLLPLARETSAGVQSDTALWEDVLLPQARAAAGLSQGLLGTIESRPLSDLLSLRATNVATDPRLLLVRQVEAYVDAAPLPHDVALVDTPGVTSQNPAHKDFAFQIVASCHAVVIVEPFDSPLSKGPDELMDAFFDRSLVQPDRVGTPAKVFVVLNKCDLAPADSQGKHNIKATLDRVVQRYQGAWGVPASRVFWTSALTALQELQGGGAGPTSIGVDELLLSFRALKSALDRYLLDETIKRDELRQIDELTRWLAEIEVGAQYRLESIDSDTAERKILEQRHSQALLRVERLQEQATGRLSSSTIEIARDLRHSLSSAVMRLVEQLESETAEQWANFGLSKAVFSRWMRAVLHADYTRVMASVVHSWLSRELPAWLGDSFARAAADALKTLCDQVEDTVGNDYRLLQGSVDWAHELSQVGAGAATDLSALRGHWDLVVDQIGGVGLRAVHKWVRAFGEQVCDETIERLPRIADEVMQGVRNEARSRLEQIAAVMRRSIADARKMALQTHQSRMAERTRLRYQLTQAQELGEIAGQARERLEAY